MFIIQWLFEKKEMKPIRKSITENADLDRYIFDKLSDAELIRKWDLNRRIYFDVINDQYIRRRLSKYKDIEKYKKKNESWKRFFVVTNYYIFKLKIRFHFRYISGNFKKYFELLKKDRVAVLTHNALRKDNIDLFLSLGKSFFFMNENTLYAAFINGSMKIVRYLLKEGVKIPEWRKFEILETVADKGHFEALKYLVEEQKFDIHHRDEAVLRMAARSGHFNIVKYAIEKGANINVRNGASLASATAFGYFEIVKYLVERGSIITPKAYEFSRKNKCFDIAEYLLKHFEYKKLEV